MLWGMFLLPLRQLLDALKDFLKWALTDGQKQVEELSYAKLPQEVVAKELKAINSIQ